MINAKVIHLDQIWEISSATRRGVLQRARNVIKNKDIWHFGYGPGVTQLLVLETGEQLKASADYGWIQDVEE